MDGYQISTLADVGEALKHHEDRSQKRYEKLMEKVESQGEGKAMEMGAANDKTVINLNGGGESGGRGGSSDALMAAALLNGRNQDPASYAAMLNNHGGMQELWPLLLLFGLGDKFGGRGREDCNEVSPAQAAILQTLLNGQSDMRAQIGTTALETQNSFLSELSRLALGTQTGFANLGDKVTNSATVLATAIGQVNQNVLEQGCQTRAQVLESENRIIRRIDDARIDEANRRSDRFELQAQFAAQFAALNSKVEVNQTVTNVATANAEARATASALQDLNHQISCLISGHNQLASSVSRITQFGTGNVATPTNTTTNQQG